MQVSKSCDPAYSVVTCVLDVGEEIYVERDAMVAMSQGIKVSGSVGSGGVVKALLRKSFGDENFLVGKYTGQEYGAWVTLAPKLPGDIAVTEASPDVALRIQTGSFLASSASVQTGVRVNKLQPVLLKEGLTALSLKGLGQIIFASYGAIMTRQLEAGQTMIVDTGHLVAWHDTIKLKVGPLTDIVSSQVTGEGLVGVLTGPGQVWIQTRSEQSLQSWLFPERDMNHSKK